MGFRARLSLVTGLMLLAALMVGAGIAGYLMLRYQQAADVTRSLETTLGIVALGLVVLGVVVALVGWWGMIVLILRPVREVQRGAEALVQGQPDRGEAAFRPDDIGRVGLSMKVMASRLRQNKADVERHSMQVETLYRVSLSLTKRLELESVLETVLNAAFELFPGLMDALVFLYSDGHLSLAASRWAPSAAGGVAPAPRMEGSTYRVARTGEMVLIPDVRADPRYPGDPRSWPGALACIPLKVGTHVVGVLNASYVEAHPFGEQETRLLQLLADQAAIAVENARLYGQAQQELLERRRAEQALQKANEDLERKVSGRTHALLEANQRLETLKEIDRAVLAAHSMDDIAMAGLSRLRALVGCEHADLVLFELEQGIGRMLTMEGPRTFGLETGMTSSTICRYSSSVRARHSGVTPATSFGVLRIVKRVLPGSTRSGA